MNPLPEGHEYRHARKPTGYELAIREVWLACRRSVPKAAFELGCDRLAVIRAVDVCADWLQDSGWTARYQLALRLGFSIGDAELHADQEADFNTRQHG